MPSETDTVLRFEFDHAQGDAVDVQHQVGALFVLARDGDLLGDGKVVGFGLLPVDEPDGLLVLPDFGLHANAVAQQRIHFLIDVVEAFALVVGYFGKLVEGFGDERRAVALPPQVGAEDLRLYVAVADAVFPVAQVAVAEFVLK